MDTVGTFSMAEALSQENCLTAIHKHYPIEKWQRFRTRISKTLKNIMASTGILEHDFHKLCHLIERCPAVEFICIDVANGYTQIFVDYLKTKRGFPKKTLIAGNLVTAEMTEELIISGADGKNRNRPGKRLYDESQDWGLVTHNFLQSWSVLTLHMDLGPYYRRWRMHMQRRHS